MESWLINQSLLHADSCPGRQQVLLAQVAVLLPLTWVTQIKFLDPSFTLDIVGILGVI